MNNVDLCLNEVNNVIPCEILKVVFHTEDMSLRESIKREIWDKIVLLDLDAFGGEMMEVPLDGLPYEERMVDLRFNRIYHIPKNRTKNKSITSALNILHTPYYSASFGVYNTAGFNIRSSPARSGIQKAFNRYTDSRQIMVTDIKLIGENLISAIFPNMMFGPDHFKLECIVQNDATLNNFDIKAMDKIIELFVLATKRYIYNKLIIKLDKGMTLNGYEVGEFKSVVDSYSDAAEQYNELKRSIGALSMVGNVESRIKLFKTVYGV